MFDLGEKGAGSSLKPLFFFKTRAWRPDSSRASGRIWCQNIPVANYAFGVRTLVGRPDGLSHRNTLVAFQLPGDRTDVSVRTPTPLT